MKRSESRKYSFLLLFQFEFHEQFEYKELFDAFWDDPTQFTDCEPIPQYTDTEKDYVWQKIKNVLDHLNEIDIYLNKYAKNWSVDRMSKIDRSILRLAVYEILFDSEIPNKVAINEAVELAKSFGEDSSYSFINGILKSIYKIADMADDKSNELK